ncbi:guanylate kinase [Nesterenkonia natronophila]|uniref:Guanylate kinase n=1 Tax=Nesterenkonia natronophila TaxID=2174932 RepID=A0A3A4EZT3_9MICC|nr:guanylate kinase [Nesterenkonia natronophila]RJN31146.1 guanylate kinase [Nesterenkonia natronophila]
MSSEASAPQVTVLAGPTSVGKSTLSRYVRETYPQVHFSVSATTRPARPGEVNGEDYLFISDRRFDELLAEDAFLEWAVVHQKYRYGTLTATVEEALSEGKNVLLEIDLQGARQVRAKLRAAQFVFLAPPSFDDLVQRLIGRGTESEEEQQRRLETARIELAAESEFDVTIINDDIERAARELIACMGIELTTNA